MKTQSGAKENVACSQVLDIPELLVLIMRHCVPSSQANAARVAKSWFLPAVRPLWHSIDDVRNIFATLGDIHQVGRGSPMNDMSLLEFRNLPKDENWARFAQYAELIRKLNLRNMPYLSSQLFTDAYFFASSHEQPVLFPTLSALIYGISESDHFIPLPLILTPTITSLTLICRGHDMTLHATGLSRLLMVRLPCLTEICVDAEPECWNNASKDSLAFALSSFNHLTKYQAPMWLLAHPAQWRALSKLPNLVTLQSRPEEEFSTTAVAFNPGTFNSLQRLSIEVPCHIATRLFQEHFPTLSTITLICLAYRHNDWVDLLATLSGITSIITLHIDLEPLRFVPQGSELLPLASLMQLTSLCITGDTVFIISDEDLERIGAALPNLNRLVLSPCPIVIPSNPSFLTLNVIERLSIRCKTLKHLALYINTDQSNSACQRSSPDPYLCFETLRTLNMGFSSLREIDVFAVVHWLSGICPSGTIIQSEQVRWNAPDGSDSRNPARPATQTGWNKVAKGVQEQQKHDRFIRRPLEENIEALRAELQSLREEA